MKKRATIAVIAMLATAVLLHQYWPNSSARKSLYARWVSRSTELEAWVDRVAESGAINTPKDEIGSFLYVGSYDIGIDFERARYGLDESAAARVVLDEGRSPVSVVFIDNSRCAIVVALAGKEGASDRFGRIPAELNVVSPRIATFCVERD